MKLLAIIALLLIIGCVADSYGNESSNAGTLEPDVQNVSRPIRNDTVITTPEDTSSYPAGLPQ